MIMLKKSFIVLFILTFFHVQSQEIMDNSIYQFKVEDIYGVCMTRFNIIMMMSVCVIMGVCVCGVEYT